MAATRRKGPPAGRSKGGSSSVAKRRRSAQDPFLDDVGGLIFSGELEDTNAHQARDGEESNDRSDAEEEEQETAEQRRLRLGKAYLARLRQSQEQDQDDDALGGDTEDAVAQRLQEEALHALGHHQRRLAHLVQLPALCPAQGAGLPQGSRMLRGHKLPVTSCSLTADDSTAFSVSKCGVVMRWDVESGKGSRLATPKGHEAAAANPQTAKRPSMPFSSSCLLASAVSSDGQYLAVGGGDGKVHVYDARKGEYIQGYSGHQGAVTCLAFREGSHTLLSGGTDRTIKIWSLDDKMYVDTLFGHQADVLCLDMLRAERVVSGGHDRTCRVWKIPEESQLIFRAPSTAVESVRYVTGDSWVSGCSDGSLCLWSSGRKKPTALVHGAHAVPRDGAGQQLGAGCIEDSSCGWVLSVASSRGSDLVASGAGSGFIRLWSVGEGLRPVGSLPVRGFVNSLQVARSGRFLIAGMGQEPRLGRWVRDGAAKNGLLVAPIHLQEEQQ